MNIKILPLLLCLGLAQATGSAFASESHNDIVALRQQLQALSARLDVLEASNLELKTDNQRLKAAQVDTEAAILDVRAKTTKVAEQASAKPAKASWADRVSLKGDFRARYENIDEQGKSTRNRDRVRARASIVAKVSDQIEVGLGMASGGDDPVSTNQTLGSGGSSKGLNLDLAYFKWSGLGNTTIYGGKFKNHLFKPGKHSMLWDGDWTPEGFGFAWDNGDYFVNGIGTWLESDSNKETEFASGIQAGMVHRFGGGMKLTTGLAYYHFGTAGKSTFYGDSDDFFGNSFNPVTDTYLYDYNELEFFADLGFAINGNPANVFLDYVRNQDAGEFDSGYSLGFKYGSAKSEGDWEFAYIFEDIEADAVFGLLTDSDFAGGGTDGKGHILKGGYALRKNVNASFTYFITERNANTGSPRDYDRLQLDLAFKY